MAAHFTPNSDGQGTQVALFEPENDRDDLIIQASRVAKLRAWMKEGKYFKASRKLHRWSGDLRTAGNPALRGAPPERLPDEGQVAIADKLRTGLPDQSDRWQRMDEDYGTQTSGPGGGPLVQQPNQGYEPRFNSWVDVDKMAMRTVQRAQALQNERHLRAQRAHPSQSVMSFERKDELTGNTTFAAKRHRWQASPHR